MNPAFAASPLGQCVGKFILDLKTQGLVPEDSRDAVDVRRAILDRNGRVRPEMIALARNVVQHVNDDYANAKVFAGPKVAEKTAQWLIGVFLPQKHAFHAVLEEVREN